VKASATLIRESWQPTPAPSWVTVVPSLRHHTLVASFAERLAAELGLRFVACVRKTRDTEPQKKMQNSYRQVANLAGAFAIDSEQILPGPALLVDDMVDSRWTFTLVSAELRHAGCEMVYPFALADTSRSET
jgi:ATP-dependent DNA helicase RecQ